MEFTRRIILTDLYGSCALCSLKAIHGVRGEVGAVRYPAIGKFVNFFHGVILAMLVPLLSPGMTLWGYLGAGVPQNFTELPH